MGSLKPGRSACGRAGDYCLIDWIARHICTRGTLGRIGTIHSAHWVFIEQYRRGFFCTSYDGGHEAYMDDSSTRSASD